MSTFRLSRCINYTTYFLTAYHIFAGPDRRNTHKIAIFQKVLTLLHGGTVCMTLLAGASSSFKPDVTFNKPLLSMCSYRIWIQLCVLFTALISHTKNIKWHFINVYITSTSVLVTDDTGTGAGWWSGHWALVVTDTGTW